MTMIVIVIVIVIVILVIIMINHLQDVQQVIMNQLFLELIINFLQDVQQVSELLHQLASQAIVTRFGRFSSMPMLAIQQDTDEQ